MDEYKPELGGTLVPPVKGEHPRKKGSGKKFVFVGIALLLMAILVGAIGCGVYYYSKHPDPKPVTQAVVEQPENKVPEVLLEKGAYTGHYGASIIEFNMDFSTGSGTRFYTADPYNVYTLRLTEATPSGNDGYDVEIEEYIEGRIKVGVFKGRLTDSDFSGEYISTHGDSRNFKLTR
ncbi:MAG: hypothetical protein K2O00_09175 [Muribaculaceae bacterium]|nr:hypothetical protein [Muribaculaceae bacterium]